MVTVLLLIVGGTGLVGSASAAPSSSSTAFTESLVPLDTATLTSNMRHWTTDYAVMFYAPWCEHCKKDFMPLWEEVSMQMAEEDPKGKRKLVMAKFDCEQDTTAAAFCQEIKLQFYPTFMFFGAGKFHDHDPLSGVVFGPRPTEHASTAKYPSSALVYHEVMAQWTKTMHFISGSSRVMQKLNFFGRMMGRLNIFGGGRESKPSYEQQLVAEIEALERKNQQLQDAMARGASGEGEQASELPYGNGDPYRELWEVGYDAEFEPVMSCVIDMADQYCAVEGVKEADPWCSTLESCIATNFMGDECWPSTCPLLEQGCQIASFCLTPELLEHYMELYRVENETAEDKAAAAAAGEEEGAFWTWPEGSPAEGEEEVAAADPGAAAGGEQTGAAPSLPPFFGRRPAAGAGAGGVDRAGDDRAETVAA